MFTESKPSTPTYLRKQIWRIPLKLKSLPTAPSSHNFNCSVLVVSQHLQDCLGNQSCQLPVLQDITQQAHCNLLAPLTGSSVTSLLTLSDFSTRICSQMNTMSPSDRPGRTKESLVKLSESQTRAMILQPIIFQDSCCSIICQDSTTNWRLELVVLPYNTPCQNTNHQSSTKNSRGS